MTDGAPAGPEDRTGPEPSNTRFLNFNPKWNTRYLDFLVSKGKAKVTTKGSIRINTTTTGTVTAATQLFNLENGEPLEPASGVEGFLYVPDASYAVTATDSKGTVVIDTANGVVPAGASYPWMLTKLKNGTSEFYTIKSRDGVFDNGRSAIKIANVSVTTTEKDAAGNDVVVDVPWNTSEGYLAQKGFRVETKPSSYGFTLSLTPVVAEKSTQMTIDIRNDSLIGWNSDGTPRISRDTRTADRGHDEQCRTDLRGRRTFQTLSRDQRRGNPLAEEDSDSGLSLLDGIAGDKTVAAGSGSGMLGC